MPVTASEPDRDISKVGGRVDDRDHDDGDDGVGGSHVKMQKHKERRVYGRGKQVVLLPFTKANKYLKNRKRNSKIKLPSNSSSSSAAASAATGKRVIGSCFCFNHPSSLESPAESCTSDPNDSKFTFDMLRTLIEKNDFYSKECNPHLNAATLSSNNSNG